MGNLRKRVEQMERGAQLSIPLLIAADCEDIERLTAEAGKLGRPVLVVSNIDERL